MGISKNSGGFTPPNHPMFNRIFHYFHHPFWGYHYFWFNTPMKLREFLENLGGMQRPQKQELPSVACPEGFGSVVG